MVRNLFCVVMVMAVVVVWGAGSGINAWAQCDGDTHAHAAGVSDAEVTAEVPELDELHEVIYEFWHNAYPDKDYALIKELLPRADELTANLDAAELPGILRDKQAKWDEGKVALKAALDGLHKAAEADDEEAMLAQTEAFHTAFEKLVRTIRPMVKELDAFHQELYKLYHYYAPEYDLDQIRAAAAAMHERMGPLMEAKLSKRLAERQEDFAAAVKKLSAAVDGLMDTAKKDDKDAVLAAVETVHTRYVNAEKIFD